MCYTLKNLLLQWKYLGFKFKNDYPILVNCSDILYN